MFRAVAAGCACDVLRYDSFGLFSDFYAFLSFVEAFKVVPINSHGRSPPVRQTIVLAATVRAPHGYHAFRERCIQFSLRYCYTREVTLTVARLNICSSWLCGRTRMTLALRTYHTTPPKIIHVARAGDCRASRWPWVLCKSW